MTRSTVALSSVDAPLTLVCPLSQAHDEGTVGGKAFNLARLMALGVPVPDGDVLTRCAFDTFLSESHIGRWLDELCADLGAAATPEALQHVADRARALIMATRLPIEVDLALDDIAQRWLRGGAVAVRSSAIGEDSGHSSFAGQFDSVLDVTSPEGLRNAVRLCYASYWSARALFYRRSRRVAPAGMAIVIQRQVTASVAGVLFTHNPDSQSRAHDTLVIEYCGGLADRLVSGQIDPGRVVVSRATGAIVSENTPEDVGVVAARAIVANHLVELARLALSIEERFGSAQDIEWTIDGAGRVWLVQSRPITTAVSGCQTPSCQETNNTLVLWTNANVSENFPQPISPLLYSIASLGYYHYFRNLGLAFGVSRRRLDAMERPLRSIIGVHGARMYYNLTNIHAVLRLAPFGDRLAEAFNTFVGAAETAPPPPGALSWRDRRSYVTRWFELLRIVRCTTWQYLFLGRRIQAFERTADVFGDRTRPETLESASLQRLGAELAAFVDIRCSHWKNASLADAAAMVTYASLERVLARGGFGIATHTRLLRALPGLPSSVPPRRLWALSRMIRNQSVLRSLFESADTPSILAAIRKDDLFASFRRAFDEYLHTWGFRSSAELMLTFPGLDERPEPVIELLKQYALQAGESPEGIIARQGDERRRETSRVLRMLARRSPFRAAAVWLLVRWTQRSVAYRERVRFKQALLYTRCRRLALRIGDLLVRSGQLVSRDDVFMLTWPEIDELTSGRAMFPRGALDLVRLRQRQHALESQLTPPDTFRLPDGDAFTGNGEASTAADESSVDILDAGVVLSGTTACGGRVSARAAVLGDVSEAARLAPGDVLVTRQTDPGWGPVFCLVSGLVIERGGMLSHGAIIAREFGLPCVVGVKNATRRIPHGATVTVDGDRGLCVLETRR